MARKRGRPKKEPPDRLAQRLDLRVSDEEKNIFKLAAKAANKDLSVWIRVVLQEAANEQLPEIHERHEGPSNVEPS